MNSKSKVCSLLAFGMSLYGMAQQEMDSIGTQQLDEVVVTDSKFVLKREHSGKVITKITQRELQQFQGRSVAEIINATAGIEINGAKSHAGQNLAYYIRGGRNRQVLVLIDGIAVTDPSQIANDYDLRLVNADQVESIEILKGASSTLYGSGAATAVINIVLKSASKKAFSANFKSMLGSNQSAQDDNYAIEDFRTHVAVHGTLDKLNYMASFGNQFTDGLSVISEGTESDAYNAINGYLKLGYGFSEAFELNTTASFDRFKAHLDETFFGMDTDDLSRSDQYRIGLAPKFNYKHGSISANVAYNHVEREIFSDFPARFEAESYFGDLYNRYRFNESFYTILGVNVQNNSMSSVSIPFGGTDFEMGIRPETANFTLIDPYANAVYISKFGLNVNAGARLNNHSEYGSHLVYSLNPSFVKNVDFGYLKGMASYSTAFIAPSLYQLFEPSYGNSELKPEENATFEIGAEIHIKHKATFSMVYFVRKEQNFIDFIDMGNFVFQYKNIATDFTATGIEFSGNYQLTKSLGLTANATYTNVEERLNLRIPKLKWNAQMHYRFGETSFLSLSYQYNDDRKESIYNSDTFMNEEVTLKSYGLLDLYLSHDLIKDRLMLFASVTNLLNEDYMELYGYSTKGRNVALGFNIRL